MSAVVQESLSVWISFSFFFTHENLRINVGGEERNLEKNEEGESLRAERKMVRRQQKTSEFIASRNNVRERKEKTTTKMTTTTTKGVGRSGL